MEQYSKNLVEQENGIEPPPDLDGLKQKDVSKEIISDKKPISSELTQKSIPEQDQEDSSIQNPSALQQNNGLEEVELSHEQIAAALSEDNSADEEEFDNESRFRRASKLYMIGIGQEEGISEYYANGSELLSDNEAMYDATGGLWDLIVLDEQTGLNDCDPEEMVVERWKKMMGIAEVVNAVRDSVYLNPSYRNAA